MPKTFIVTVLTNYDHRFTEDPPKAIYDKDGYIIGAITDIEEGDLGSIVDERIREIEDRRED
jgi:hypothetical protein